MCRRKDFNSATYNMIMMNRCGWSNNGQKKGEEEPEQGEKEPPAKPVEDFKKQPIKAVK
jgi:hypothetical protein